MKTIILSGKWALYGNGYQLRATVPGDITGDLVDEGMIEHPYVGYNYEQCLFVQKSEWVYEKTFEIEESYLKEQLFLLFKGIDTYAQIYLNGRFIGETSNMFLEYRFPVNGIAEKNNVLTVKMKPIYDQMGEEPQNKYCSVFHPNRIFVRKAQCHFGWDWAPKFPGYGIYRDVVLEIRSEDCIDEVKIVTSVQGEVSFFTQFNRIQDGNIVLSVEFDKKEVACVNAALDGCKKLLNIKIQNLQLWWPNGYGEQNLYSYTLKLYNKEGVLCDIKQGEFGIREVVLRKSMIDSEHSDFAFYINGRKIFVRGSNWVPADLMTGRITSQKYETLLRYAREGNFNMLRVWGGGIYESDEFYSLCDRFGIMLWQDFMFTCQEVPDDIVLFREEIEKEAVFQVKRLRNHPSLVFWCGINETSGSFNRQPTNYGDFTLNILLRGIVACYDGTRPYERTSPVGFSDIENETWYGDSHNNVSEVFLFGGAFKGFEGDGCEEKNAKEIIAERTRNYYRFLEITKNNFSSECAVLGVCNYESLRKFIPQDSNISFENEFFKDRFLGNPYTYVMPTFVERQIAISEALYGKIINLKDFAQKGCRAHALILNAEILYARTNGYSSGIMNWMYNDIWPTGTWSVVDWYLDKKPAYYVMKRAFQPQIALLQRIGEEVYVCAANNESGVLSVSAEVGIKKYSGEIIRKKSIQITLKQDECRALPIGLSLEGGDYVYLVSDDGKYRSTYDLNYCRGVGAQLTYSVVTETTKDGEVATVSIAAQTFVPFVQIVTLGECEDNYFDLDAGEVKTVRITGKGPLSVSVRAFSSTCTE